MKIKKIILSLSLMMLTLTPVKASCVERLLLLSKDLPYLIYVERLSETKITVNLIPADLQIPLSCAGDTPAALSSLDFENNTECVRQSIEQFLAVKFTDTVYLHMDRISNDTGVSMKDIDFRSLKELTAFFAKVAKNADISMILNYRQYITSDLSLSDYYSYYKASRKKLQISYGFMNYMEVDHHLLPMDNLIHIRKQTQKN